MKKVEKMWKEFIGKKNRDRNLTEYPKNKKEIIIIKFKKIYSKE